MREVWCCKQSQGRAVSSFIQTPDDYAEPSLVQSDDEQPQSGQIFGILKQVCKAEVTSMNFLMYYVIEIAILLPLTPPLR